jgi:hypothetical protein
MRIHPPGVELGITTMEGRMEIGSCRVYLGLALAGCLALAPGAGWAANARNPYSNVNHANDAGNDTGDSQVDALNQAQLSAPGQVGGAYGAPGYGYAAPPPAYPAPAYPPPAYARPAYPPPTYAAPAYVPSPYYYYPAPVYAVPVPRPYYYRW